ncbi:MAG: sodium:proton antiporter NhaD [Chromatiales bacterium]|jgi:Na+/H+ antiporter NhaD/arsenite permease-like protein
MTRLTLAGASAALALRSGTASAAETGVELGTYSDHWAGWLCLAIFAAGLIVASLEEFTGLRKSKPMVLAAGAIWAVIAWVGVQSGQAQATEAAVRQNLLQYVELMVFLLVAMTYVNAMDERRVFAALRGWIVSRGYTFRQLFWVSGATSFLLSPLLENLTTAILMGAIVLASAGAHPRFVALAFVNIVVAVNAGGAFSPFGDLTTLMVWQQNIQTPQGPVGFASFLALAAPALLAFLIPALLMQRALPSGTPGSGGEPIAMRRGARRILVLFLATIATAVVFQGVLHLPAAIGMATGLSYLQFFGFFLKKTHRAGEGAGADEERLGGPIPLTDGGGPFDVFDRIARVEWDALFFLYGAAMSVGGLAYLGYLSLSSEIMYSQWGPLAANLGIGALSAVVENVPAMLAVLAMTPDMPLGHWLLVTLTAGTGGSLLAIGSAAGVALMSQSRGTYTFFAHLRWTPVIALGWAAAVLAHLWINASLFRAVAGT